MLSTHPKDSKKSLMVPLSDFKKSLGETANKMTEEQILILREQQDKLAEIFFAMWQEEVKAKKNTI